ncbi:hypothetical protein AB1Y20_019397 [Prymnesium parvum]|uniref:Uncharacterized protein n=1 Tax=Prymnesium parvum TaxID=97485 RepID=A0AB34JTW2_PRYPA
MPTRVMTQHEMNESKMMVDLATLLLAAARGEDVEDRRLAELLILAAAEPFTWRLVQEIGHSHLSIRRLRREAAESGMEEGDVNWSVYSRFGFRLADLPTVVASLDVPAGIRPFAQYSTMLPSHAPTILMITHVSAPVDSRGILMQLTFGSMRSQHGLLSQLARLVHGLGCHATHRARAATGFRRGMRVLTQLAAVVTGLPAELQEVADVVATELRAIAWGIEFEQLGAHS